MDRLMDGKMDKWVQGWMDIDGWRDGQQDKWIRRYMHKQIDKQINRQPETYRYQKKCSSIKNWIGLDRCMIWTGGQTNKHVGKQTKRPKKKKKQNNEKQKQKQSGEDARKR